MSDTKNLLSCKGIIDAAEKIERFSFSFSSPDELFADQKSFDAICMNFIVIGEMADRISDPFKSKHDTVDWKKIKGLRNIIAHDYFGVDAEEIWGIIKTDIPVLLESIRRITG